MGHLAFLGSHRVNGVSALHTELMRRRYSATCTRSIRTASSTRPTGSRSAAGCIQANPELTALIVEAIGRRVLDDADALADLAPITRTMRRFATSAPRCAARTRSRSRGSSPSGSASGSIPTRCSTCRSSASTSTSGSSSTSSRRSRSTTRSAPQPTHAWVPRVKIFAGKAAAGYHQAKLIIKLANDVARVDQQRSGGARAAQGRVPAELQREPGRSDHSRGRPVRADLDRRHGGVRHRQHEARAQRRADDRHARRRQHRDPRARRRRELCSSSASPPTRSRQRRRAGSHAHGDDRGVARARRGARCRSRAGCFLARTTAPLSRPGRRTAAPRLFHGRPRISTAITASQRAVDDAVGNPEAWWRAVDRATRRTSAAFRRTATIGEYARDVWGLWAC